MPKKNLFIIVLTLVFFSLITKLVFALGTDVTPPDVTITVTCNTTPTTILSNNSACEADTAEIKIDYADADSGLLTISHAITNDSNNVTDGAAAATYSYTASKTSSAGYTISADATDAANNKSPVSSFTFSFLTGEISDANFGISNSCVWWQMTGGDFRDDNGVTNCIPVSPTPTPGGPTDTPTPTPGGPTPTPIIVPPGRCDPHASIANTTNLSPGIIFSGVDSYSFCLGVGTCQDRSSSTQWVVKGSVFNPNRPGVMRTSYESYTTLARQNNITLTPLTTTQCGSDGLTSCVLSSNLENGIYTTDDNDPATTDNLTLTGTEYNFLLNKNYVILVNGNLIIKTNIKIPLTSTVTFSVSGDITVDKTIGETDPTSTATNIEGFYSADKNFIIDGNGISGCAAGGTKDRRLNIAGSVIVNAGLTTGRIINNRDLCSENLQCPTYNIIQRPDFILYAPDFIKHPNYIWQEVAP